VGVVSIGIGVFAVQLALVSMKGGCVYEVVLVRVRLVCECVCLCLCMYTACVCVVKT
jgi:hypothetical protein